jgi:hypothetical protein
MAPATSLHKGTFLIIRPGQARCGTLTLQFMRFATSRSTCLVFETLNCTFAYADLCKSDSAATHLAGRLVLLSA